jgi:hypothetical protein
MKDTAHAMSAPATIGVHCKVHRSSTGRQRFDLDRLDAHCHVT